MYTRQNADLNFGTLACSGKIICDGQANLTVHDASVQGNLFVDGALVSPPWQSFPLVTWDEVSEDSGYGVTMTADADWESIWPIYFVKSATLSSMTFIPYDTLPVSGNASIEFWSTAGSPGTHLGTASFTASAFQVSLNAPWGATWVQSNTGSETIVTPVTVPIVETTVGSLNVPAGTTMYARILKGDMIFPDYMMGHVNLV